jgi:hypothetical protein
MLSREIGPLWEMDNISRLFLITAYELVDSEVFQSPTLLKLSVNSNSARPGCCSGVGRMVAVGKMVGVLVGGNQIMEAVEVVVAAIIVLVGVTEGGTSAQAVSQRRASKNLYKIVDFME